MHERKKLYIATISYRTPCGRRTLYGSSVAAADDGECAANLIERLSAEVDYGRRKVARLLDDFRCVSYGVQAGKGPLMSGMTPA